MVTPQRDDFTVKTTHNKELAGKRFEDLDADSKSAILDYEFIVHVLPSRIDDREIIQIFRRMNSTNYTLTKQEHRNAQWFGEFKTSVYQLAAEQLTRWRTWKTFTEDDIARMSEVEHTAECLLVILNKIVTGKSASKIDKAFKDYDETYPHREEVERRFRDVMDAIDKHFSSYTTDFVFFKKTLLYTFFAFMYEMLFGLNMPLTKIIKPKLLSTDGISKIKLVSERINDRTAPANVLEATDRRTTNPKERKSLFDYLVKSVEHAK